MLEKVLGIFKTVVLFKASSIGNTCDLLSLTGLQLAGTLCASCPRPHLSFHFPSLLPSSLCEDGLEARKEWYPALPE